MKRDDVERIVREVAYSLRTGRDREFIAEPLGVYGVIQRNHPEVIAYLRRYFPRQDPYQIMKRWIPRP